MPTIQGEEKGKKKKKYATNGGENKNSNGGTRKEKGQIPLQALEGRSFNPLMPQNGRGSMFTCTMGCSSTYYLD